MTSVQIFNNVINGIISFLQLIWVRIQKVDMFLKSALIYRLSLYLCFISQFICPRNQAACPAEFPPLSILWTAAPWCCLTRSSDSSTSCKLVVDLTKVLVRFRLIFFFQVGAFSHQEAHSCLFFCVSSLWCWILLPFNSLGVADWWHSNHTIPLLFVSSNNPISLVIIWWMII